jgi:hypothetical protein
MIYSVRLHLPGGCNAIDLEYPLEANRTAVYEEIAAALKATVIVPLVSSHHANPAHPASKEPSSSRLLPCRDSHRERKAHGNDLPLFLARSKAGELPHSRHDGRIQVGPQAFYNRYVVDIPFFRHIESHQ